MFGRSRQYWNGVIDNLTPDASVVWVQVRGKQPKLSKKQEAHLAVDGGRPEWIGQILLHGTKQKGSQRCPLLSSVARPDGCAASEVVIPADSKM